MIKICFDSSALGKLIDLPEDDSKNTLAMERIMQVIENSSKNYELSITPIFVIELKKAFPQRIIETKSLLNRYRVSVIENNTDAEHLADLYLENKVLPAKCYFDMLHIAYASVAGVDYLISCDKHFFRSKTVKMVSDINTAQNVSVPKIISPLELWQLFHRLNYGNND